MHRSYPWSTPFFPSGIWLTYIAIKGSTCSLSSPAGLSLTHVHCHLPRFSNHQISSSNRYLVLAPPLHHKLSSFNYAYLSKKSFHQKTKFSFPSRYYKNKKTLTPPFQDKFSALVFNHLQPRIFERHAPISLSGLRRLNRGSCHTPNLSYPLIRNLGFMLLIHLHLSFRS